MLVILPRSQEALRSAAMPGFRERMRRVLADAHPHFLPCFPHSVQQVIVGNMLDRAAMWRLGRQDSLHAYCTAMIAVAPNFDESPPIAARLREHGEQLDSVLADLIEGMPETIRRGAAKSGSNLPLFIPAALRDRSEMERTVTAIPVALYDRPEAARAASAAGEAVPYVDALGLTSLPDALLVVAACRSFWGPRFQQLPWAARMQAEVWSPPARLALLRLRLAIEFGRFI